MITTSIENLSRDIEIQGPHFPSDAVCTFFTKCLIIAANDIRLFRLRLPEKIFLWLSTNWKPMDGIYRSHNIGQTRPRADPLSPLHLVTLISRICAIEKTLDISPTRFIPDCAIANMTVDICETSVIRSYIEAQVPSYSREDPPEPRTSPSTTSNAIEGIERRVSAWLERTLNTLILDGADMGEAYWTTMNSDSIRRHLDLASVVLIVQGLFDFERTHTSGPAIKSACSLLVSLAPTLAFKKWRSDERAFILAGLDLLFVPFYEYPSVSFPALLDPGVASGIPKHLLPIRSNQSKSFDLLSFPFTLLRNIWKKESTTQALAEVEASLQFILTGVESVVASVSGSPSQATQNGATQRAKELEEAEDNDSFGEIKVGKASQLSALLLSERAESSVIALCVRGLISGEMATAQAGVPVREGRLVEALVTADIREAVVIAEQVFNAILSGLLTFRLSEAEEILTRIGGDLEDYRCARDEKFALVALRFLECTASNWIMQDDATQEFGTNSRTLCAFFVSNLQHKRINSWRVRLRFAAFLDRYLSIDRKQIRWALKREDCMDDDTFDADGTINSEKIEEYMARAGDGSILYPTGIIPSLLNDIDFRVRFRSASSAPQLLTLCRENGQDDRPVFLNIKNYSSNDVDRIEEMLTQILCNSNIVIASASRRRSAYINLISIAQHNPLFSLVVEAVLSSVALRLGLPNHAALYRVFSRAFTHAMIVSDPGAPEPRACGYPSLLEMRKADFKDAGCVYLAYKMENTFNVLCEVLNRSKEEVAMQCLPDTLAISVLRILQVKEDYDPAKLEKKLTTLALATGTHDPEELIKSVASDVVAAMLASIYFINWPSEALSSMLATGDIKYSTTLKSIFNTLSPFDLNMLPQPTFKPETVAEACILFDKKYNCLSDLASLHSIVQQLLSLARRAPFYDLQRIHLLAVGIALSIGSPPDTTILATLTKSLIVLLPRIDLASIVVSMLRWSFSSWDRLEVKNESTTIDLCDSLARAAYATKSLVQVARDSKERDLALGFDKFLKGVIKKIDVRSNSRTKPLIRSAVLLWPTTIVDASTEELSNIENALSSTFAPLGKLNLLRMLQARPNISEHSASRRILWNLLAVTATVGEETIEDCLGLADFLYELAAEAQAPALDDLNRKGTKLVAGVEDDIDLQRSILSNILEFADDSDIELVEIIYSTVKSIFATATMAESLFNANTLSPRSLGLANHLSARSFQQNWNNQNAIPSELIELEGDTWVIAGRDYANWTSNFSRFLSDCRGKDDLFYAQLGPVLHESSELSIALLPLLVHSVLLEGVKDNEYGASIQLSSYFTRLLSEKHTHLRTVEAVIRIALHLRNYAPPKTPKGRTSIDSWFSIPWTTLAEGAVRSGLLNAALLFLELAHEYDNLFAIGEDNRPRAPSLDLRGQKLLYEIYEHIEEPDGFYGKQTQDHRLALIRRYHHEERWNDAFGIHGAEFESQVRHPGAFNDSSSTAGVIKSLASFGFNRLATSILQPARADGEVKDGDLEIGKSYELAWRSSTWDLPIENSARSSSSVALYSALRCVHASRDHEVLRSIVESSLVSETAKLASVGIDLPTPSTEVLSTILALREVHQWSFINISETLDPNLVQNWQSNLPPFS